MLRNTVATMKTSSIYNKHILLLFLLMNPVAAFQPFAAGNHILLTSASKTPSIALPSKLPSFDSKDFSLPSIDIPALPSIDVPTVDLNSLKSFTIDVPQFDTSALKVDETILVPAFTLVGIVIVLGALRGTSGDGTSGDGTSILKKSKKKASPLAIPYDAAARFAYDEWLMKHEGEKFNDEGYQVFQQTYDNMAVAESTYKKLVRDLEAFENKAPPPTPPRRIVPKKTPPKQTAKASPFFFANE